MPTFGRKIERLSSQLISQIAAGEVVEKPASVVKELVENSLDANASEIVITIEKGGKNLISVFDNGIGMDRDDALLAIERHATSKVYSEAELAVVTSLGFRGEALAAISSVSQFELTTCRDENKGGTQLIIHGLEKPTIRSLGFPKGTKITVSNLFYNVPARKKFLKSEQTEYFYISKLITTLAIASPSVHFRLIHNKKVVLNYPAVNDLKERLQQCWGNVNLDQIFFCEHKEAYLSFQGWFSIPPMSRKTREWQHISVNGRQIKDKYIQNAIYEGYKTLLMKQAHPLFAIQIDMLPGELDANVHPGKTQIRLKNPKLIQTIITENLQKIIKKTVRQKITSIEAQDYGSESMLYDYIQEQTGSATNIESNESVEAKTQENKKLQDQELILQTQKDDQISFSKTAFTTNKKPKVTNETNAKSVQNKIDIAKDKPLDKITAPNDKTNLFSFLPVINVSQSHLQANQATSPCQLLGQWDKRYIMAQKDTSLLLFDQHAAHERILFEKIRYEFYNNEIVSENLLIPIEISTLPHISILIERYKEEWEKFGFSIEHKHANLFTITRIPSLLKRKNIEEIIQEILHEISRFSQSNVLEIFFNQVLERMACHAAIRSGDELNQEKMQSLLDTLNILDLNLYCPHGRPVFIEITEKEADQRFKRII